MTTHDDVGPAIRWLAEKAGVPPDELVANPVARELLSGAEGVRLLTTGPSWRVSPR